MRYLSFLIVLAACNPSSDDTFNPNDVSTWGEVEASGQMPAPGDAFTLKGPDRVIEGEEVTIKVDGPYAYEAVVLAVSAYGESAGPCFDYFGGACFDISAPVRGAGFSFMDEEGKLSFDLTLPMGTAGREVCLQGAVRRGAGGAVSAMSSTLCWDVQGDSDGDGIGDDEETDRGLDPFDPDSDDDGYLDGEDCDPIDPEKNETCGHLYAAQARSCGFTGVYKIDLDAGTYDLAFDNFVKYSGLTGHNGRLFAARGGFDGNIYELNPETGESIADWYTGNSAPGISASSDGTIYANWRGSVYTHNVDDLAPTFWGSGPSNNQDIAADDEGNVYYVNYGDYGSMDVFGGGYTFLGATTGWESGTLSRDKVGAFEFHNDKFYVVNTVWSGEYSELFEFDVESGEVSYLMELPGCIDALGSTQ
jgi:hypothetical protein